MQHRFLNWKKNEQTPEPNKEWSCDFCLYLRTLVRCLYWTQMTKCFSQVASNSTSLISSLLKYSHCYYVGHLVVQNIIKYLPWCESALPIYGSVPQVTPFRILIVFWFLAKARWNIYYQISIDRCKHTTRKWCYLQKKLNLPTHLLTDFRFCEPKI